jgi:hypothetical protein
MRGGTAGAFGLTLAIALWAVFTGQASATLTHEPEPFSPITGAPGVTLHEPSGIAVDEATGNVFLTDSENLETKEGQIAILGAEAGVPAGLEPPFAIPDLTYAANTLYALAYDNVEGSAKKGTLYTYDQTTGKLKEFKRNALTKQYVLQTGASNEPELVGAGESATGAAVDGSGNVWVTSDAAESIFKVTPDGVVSKYELNPGKKGNVKPSVIAADAAGDLFVSISSSASPFGSGLFRCVLNGSGEIELEACSQFLPSEAFGAAVDRGQNHLYAALRQPDNHIVEYDIGTEKQITEFAKGVANNQIAVNEATGRIYAAEAGEHVSGKAHVNVYGPPVVVPTVEANPPTEVTGTRATLNGTVNPEGTPVDECIFEWGETLAYDHKGLCEGSLPADSEPHPVSLKVTGLKPNGNVYHYRIVAKDAKGSSRSADETVSTAVTTATEPASPIGVESATLNGLVRPEGQSYSVCKFEWGLTTVAGYQHEAECSPKAGEIPTDFNPHPVAAALSGLQGDTLYKFRLTTVNTEGELSGKELTFETSGAPAISEIRALDATQSEVRIEGKVDPRRFETSYRFEWGPTASYENSVPISPASIGSGEEPVLVTASLTGLSSGTTYHYRVVATNTASGPGTTTASPDQTFETLDACGLPDGRCLELASPGQLGPLAAPGRQLAAIEFNSQAGVQSGALAYTIEAGLPEATRGTQVLYLGTRGEGDAGWSSDQLSPPTAAPDQLTATSNPSQYFALSPDLSCGVLASNQPLTADPQARLVVESGGGNLYRRTPSENYELITNLAPENPEVATGKYTKNYGLDAISNDCRRVVFETNPAGPTLNYPGVPGNLLEWHDGTLRGVGLVPNASGGESTAEGAEAGTTINHLNVLSDNGSRLFFSAKRATGKVVGEVGAIGLFVREDGHSYDLSASDTGVPDSGATYVGATPDGAHVYFTANAGLTGSTSQSGTDLYECDIAEVAGEPQCNLKDLSPNGAGAAGVFGLVGFAENGSHVYFAARAQLLPGRGPTSAENEAANHYSIYDAGESALAYVGTLAFGDVSSADARATTTGQSGWTSRTSPDGRYLLFESRAKVTNYENDGGREVYLYDADAEGEATVCISCRQDGSPPVAPPSENVQAGFTALLAAPGQVDPLSQPRSLVLRNGKIEVFFRSYDSLAPGAPSGEFSLYEWTDGQVFLIAAQPRSIGGQGVGVTFVGASAEGADLYFFNAAALNWENPDERYAAWDARIGGGFAEPPAPPPGCDPSSEGSCQGSSTPPPATPSAATPTSNGPGNVKAKKNQKKHHKKKHHKKKKNHKKSKQAKHARRSHR